MQLSRESSTSNIIRACEPGRIQVGNTWHAGHLIVSRNSILADWTPKQPQEWDFDDLSLALTLQPEILLLGAGTAEIIPDPELMAAFARVNVGLEFMTTAAACRTYNVLAHEERLVVAALYNPPIGSSPLR